MRAVGLSVVEGAYKISSPRSQLNVASRLSDKARIRRFPLLPERLAARRVVIYKLDTDEQTANRDAARRARMRSIGVLSTHEELRADIVVRSLEELQDDAFNQLLA